MEFPARIDIYNDTLQHTEITVSNRHIKRHFNANFNNCELVILRDSMVTCFAAVCLHLQRII